MNKPFCILFSRAYRAQTAQIRPRMADQGISMGQPKIPVSYTHLIVCKVP